MNSQLNSSLQWRHNERDGVSNHRCLDCLLNRLFRRRSKKTSELRVIGFYEGNPPVTGDSHKRPVTRNLFPFDDVIMCLTIPMQLSLKHRYILTGTNQGIIRAHSDVEDRRQISNLNISTLIWYVGNLKMGKLLDGLHIHLITGMTSTVKPLI